MMKVVFIILGLSLLLPSSVFAESSASVNINNNVNSSSTSNSNVKSHTEITVETDGEVTHYESDEPGNVSVKSVNGESEIKVNGQTVSGSPTNGATKSPSPISPDDKEITEAEEETLTQIEEILKDLKEKITSLGEKLSSLFD